MWELVRTFYGYPRVVRGWRGIDQFTGRVTVGYLYRCKKCGEYFNKADAKEHRHGQSKAT